jgi:hypothetical protein
MATAITVTGRGWDGVRQTIVLVLSLAPPVATALAFGTGTTFEEATRTDTGRPLIEPAGYAFIIWTLIYAGCVAYGVFQALPSQAGNQRLREIGYLTASAFLGTAAWLVMARFGWTWLTVVCIVWMLASLAPVFIRLTSRRASLTAAERWVVAFPLSVFTGWVTVATFANTAAALKESGWSDVGLSEPTWTVLMLLAAGSITAGVTVRSRGNIAYAATVVWAMVAIAVANLSPGQSTTVAAAAGTVAVVVVLSAIYARLARASGMTSRDASPGKPGPGRRSAIGPPLPTPGPAQDQGQERVPLNGQQNEHADRLE